ncbi:MAG: 2Fe-2S iron-sulfur cluster-binding protein [Myxococcales bacterium]
MTEIAKDEAGFAGRGAEAEGRSIRKDEAGFAGRGAEAEGRSIRKDEAGFAGRGAEAEGRSIRIDFEGRRVPAVRGEPVAVALLREGHFVLSRSAKYHRPRGAFCFAGSCGNCLMRIGGLPDRLACATPCRPGLEVQSQNALPSAGNDLLRAIDWAFPKGLDHHEMFAGVPVAEAVMQKVARQLAGLGELPGSPRPAAENPPVREVSVCLVGLGAAGRAAAASLGEAASRALALDADPWLEPPPGIEAWTGARALGLYRDGGAPLVAVHHAGALHRVRPERVVLCTGSRDQNLLFGGNDLPGILGARAVRRLLTRHALLPAQRALVLGDGPDAEPTAAALLAAGAHVERFPDHRPRQARGGSRVREVVLEGGGGRVRWRGGLVAIAAPRAAAFELGAHAGVAVECQGSRGFTLRADENGATGVPWLWAAGSCTGAGVPSQEHGRRAGLAAG